MGCYYTLCHNTYAYSLLFYKVYIKRENAGSWDSGLEKEQILETYSAQLQKSWNFTEDVFQIYKKYWEQELHQGATPCPRGWGRALPPWACPLPRGPPGGPPMAIFCYMESFDEEKTRSHLSRWDSAATRRNLGGTNLGLWRSCSAGDTSLREGEIITNDPLIGRGSIFINTFTSTISSQNPSSSPVSNSCFQVRDWYLWVASSVDYSL